MTGRKRAHNDLFGLFRHRLVRDGLSAGLRVGRVLTQDVAVLGELVLDLEQDALGARASVQKMHHLRLGLADQVGDSVDVSPLQVVVGPHGEVKVVDLAVERRLGVLLGVLAQLVDALEVAVVHRHDALGVGPGADVLDVLHHAVHALAEALGEALVHEHRDGVHELLVLLGLGEVEHLGLQRRDGGLELGVLHELLETGGHFFSLIVASSRVTTQAITILVNRNLIVL